MLVSLMLIGGLASCKKQHEPGACIDEEKRNRNWFAPCTQEAKPVCGCDGVTYGNACEADRAGVTSYTDGPCNGEK